MTDGNNAVAVKYQGILPDLFREGQGVVAEGVVEPGGKKLLVATGNFQLLGELLGTSVIAVSSMSRRNMKDHELHEFWDEAKEVIKSKLLERIEDAAERERLTDTLSLQLA